MSGRNSIGMQLLETLQTTKIKLFWMWDADLGFLVCLLLKLELGKFTLLKRQIWLRTQEY